MSAKRKSKNTKRSMERAADRKAAIATFGATLNRSGGRRVWTATDGRKAASKAACRGRVSA